MKLIGLAAFSNNENIMALAQVAFSIIALIFLIYLYKDTLKSDWVKFNKKKWQKILIMILGVVVLHGVLILIRKVLPTPIMPISTEPIDWDNIVEMSPLVTFIVLLVPLSSPFIEELIFRHALFYKFKDNKVLVPIMLLVSSVLFGLIHTSNFGGNILATIPYMVLGLIFALIYWKTKNIWYSISIHFAFNFSASVLPILFVFLLSPFIM